MQRSRSLQNIDTTYSIIFYDDRLTQNAPNPSNSRALVPAWSWVRRNVDDPLFPRQGNLIRAEVGFAVKGILTDQTFGRIYTNMLQYLPLGKRGPVRVPRGAGRRVHERPLERRAGVAPLRARAARIRCAATATRASVTTCRARFFRPKHLVTGSSEYQHWFTHDSGGAAFFDIGTATDTWSERVFEPGAGLGVRWRSPVGPVTIDVAYGFKNKSIKPYPTLGIAF